MTTPATIAPISAPIHSDNSTQPQNKPEKWALTASKTDLLVGRLMVGPLIVFVVAVNVFHSQIVNLPFWLNAGFSLVYFISGAAAGLASSLCLVARVLDQTGYDTHIQRKSP